MTRVLLAISLMLANVAGTDPARSPSTEHLTPRSAYLERCGGCHGIDGRAFAATVPDLRGKVGYFLCDPAGRDYVARLPNIVFSQITDAELADLLNYVVFGLGGDSVPKDAKPYTPAEVGRTRRSALSIPDLEHYRETIVRGLIARCGAPASLESDYAPVPGPQDSAPYR